MERKNYLVEKLSKKENAYFEKIVKSARNNYLKKNFNDMNNNTIQLNENIIDEQSSVLDLVINKFETEIKSAIEFENMFSNPKLYKIAKALSLQEKMVLFALFKEEKGIRHIAKEQGIDKNTVMSRRDKFYKLVKEIIGDDKNV